MELLREVYGVILKYVYSADWIRVIGAFLILLTLILLFLWGIVFLAKKIFPATFERLSARGDHVTERIKESVLRIVLPIYMIGLLALFVLKISAILPWLFWPMTILAVVFLAWFYGTPMDREGRG